MSPRPPKLSRVAVVAAGWSGDGSTAEAGLTADDSTTRGSALAALARLGMLSIADLAGGIADPVPGVRRRALGLLPALWRSTGTEGRGELAGLLLTALTDTDPTVVEQACFVAGECPPEWADETQDRDDDRDDDRPEDPWSGSFAAALVPIATDHGDALCRESAVAALGALAHPCGRAAVLAACRDRATVRRRAVLALAAFDGPEVDAALAELVNDVDWQVRQGAEDLLAVD